MSIITKQQAWQETTKEVSHITDRLGKPVDPGIVETVVALNVLGIPTTASCEGHLEWGTCAPWVDIASKHPAAQISIGQLHTQAQQEKKRGEKSPEEIAEIFRELHDTRREVKVYHIQERQKLLTYLATFYQGRNVPYDCRLIIRPLGTDGKSRLESQGADCQDVNPLDIRAQKLTEYQAEMWAFTVFLKDVFFSHEQERE